MSAKELSSKLGLESTGISIINKNTGKEIASRTEKSPSFWTTAFSFTDKSGKESLKTVNTFNFSSEEKANSFFNKISDAMKNAKQYPQNRNQLFDISLNKKTITIEWGD